MEERQLKPTEAEHVPSTPDPQVRPTHETPAKPAEEQPLPTRGHEDVTPAEEHPLKSTDDEQAPLTHNQELPSPQNYQGVLTEEKQVTSTENQQLKSAIESLLFIAGNPLSLDRLKDIFEDVTREEIEAQIAVLRQEYEERGSGIMLAEVAGGYQLATKPENAVWIRKFRSVKVSSKLSRPALETLAIVAYKQPITRSEVEAVRGVNIGGIMRNLMERRLVKIVGKKDVPGKPMMYGTTLEFLQYFGLKDLSSLPTLKEFQELEAGEEVMEEVPVQGEDAAAAEAVTAAATEENVTG